MKENARIFIFLGMLLLIVVVISLCVSFCSFPMHRDTMTYADRVELVTGHMSDFEKDVFSGLKERDPQRIKKHFSKFAQENCNDWEEGFEYLYSLLGGSDVTFTSHSYSTFSGPVAYTPRKDAWYFEARCLFSVDGKNYEMYWRHFITYDLDPDSVGVFGMGIREDLGFPLPPIFAGIYQPGRDQCYGDFLTFFMNKAFKYNRSVKLPDLKPFFDADALAQASPESQYYLGWFLVNQQNNKICRMWIRNTDDGQIFYFEATVETSVMTLAIHLVPDGMIRGIKIKLGSYKEISGEFTSIPDGIHGFDAKLFEDAGTFDDPPAYVEPTVPSRVA